MKIIKYILIFVVVYTLSAETKDTMKVDLEEVEVNASKILSENYVKYNLHSIISSEEIQRLQPWQITEVISKISGIYIRDYGGLGGLKTVSLRGLTSSQNVILIDGVKINPSQNMSVDLSKISSSMFDKIEIIKGGNSAVFGGGALGGAINLINDISDNFVKLSANYGSFNDRKFAVNYSKINDSYANAGNLEFEASDGNYLFTIDGNKTFRRYNSDFYFFTANEMFKTSLSDCDISLMLNYSKSDRGVPGPVILGEGIKYSDARLKEQFGFGIFKLIKNLDKSSSLSLTTNFNLNTTDYRDSNFLGGNNNYQTKYLNDDIGISVKYRYTGDKINFNFSLENYYSELTSDNSSSNVLKSYYRNNFVVLSNIENQYLVTDEFDLNGFLGIRYDMFSDVQSSLSGFWGTIANLKDLPISLKTNISYNFRPPSFNELYYFNFGNNELKPEKSISLNLGLNYFTDIFRAELNGFLIFTKDQILAVPQNPIYWSAQNIQKVQVKGFELNFEGNLFDNLIFYNCNFTYSLAQDRSPNSINFDEILVYSPIITSNFSLFFVTEHFNTGLSFHYTDYYYYLPDNEDIFQIPSYFIIDYFISSSFKMFGTETELTFNIKNLTNENYYIILSYPMPGISFRGGINVKL